MVTKLKVYTADADGNELELAVLTPSGQAKQDAKLYSLAEYGRAVERGVKIRAEVERFLRRMNLWDDDRQREFEKLRKSVLDGKLQLARGGTSRKKAFQVALRMVRDRAAANELLAVRSEIEQNTAEAVAEQAHFNYLVAACTVYNDGRYEGKPYFTADGEHASVDAYVERSATKAAFDAATKFNELVYGRREDAPEDPEVDFLKKYGFVDKDGNFIDKGGNLVDEQGRRVDSDGFFVDGDGRRVDADGNPVDADGNYLVEFTEFTEDEDDE